MNKAYPQYDAACGAMQPLLSDYVDGALSARHTFEVERHLSGCTECATQVRQLEATVQMLHQAERRDTADDFMAKLHARLDDLEPEPARRRSLQDILRDLLQGMRDALRSRTAPALGLAAAAAGLMGVLLLLQPVLAPSQGPALPPPDLHPSRPVVDRQALDQQVAATASDPLGDVAAENLAVQGATGADNNNSDTTLE